MEELTPLPPVPVLGEADFAEKMALYQAAVTLRLSEVQTISASAFTDPAWSLTLISALLLPTMVQKHETLETAIPLTVSAAFKLVDELAGRVV
jgi:hypothetical protein